MYDEYVDRVSEVVTGIVQQAGDRNNVLVDLGRVEALLPRSEQVDGERYEQGTRIKAVITEVRSGTKGPQVILSRRDPELIRTLFELEVPEIADGLVEIRCVAREPGYRSKIAVESHRPGVDPVGACVGPRGSRVRMVVSELRGEKIDIIPWNTESGPLRRQGAVARTRPRGLRRRRDEGSDRHRARRPARAGDRQGGPERPPRRAAYRLEGRHRLRHRVRPAGGRGGVRRRRRRRGVHRPLRRRPLERQALPERGAARLELLRRLPAHQALEGQAAGRQPEGRRAEEEAGEGSEVEAARARRPSSRRTPRPRGREEPEEPRRVSEPVRTCAGCGRKAAAARAPALRGARRHADALGAGSRAAASTPAGGSPASSARPRDAPSTARCADRCGSSRSSRGSTLRPTEMANDPAPNRPNRPVRPRQGGSGRAASAAS